MSLKEEEGEKKKIIDYITIEVWGKNFVNNDNCFVSIEIKRISLFLFISDRNIQYFKH